MSKEYFEKKTRETGNDTILSDYFLAKSISNEPIPYMTDICKETGISHATISRYAKRKGFYNFSELRANFNKTLERERNDLLDFGFLNYLRNGKSFAIVTSKSTTLIGYYIKERLSVLGITAKLLPFVTDPLSEETFSIDENDSLIVVSLSSDSEKVNSFVERNNNKKIFYITTEEIKTTYKNMTIASLTEYKYLKRDSYEMFKSVKKINDWLSNIFNIFHIEKMNEYENKK